MPARVKPRFLILIAAAAAALAIAGCGGSGGSSGSSSDPATLAPPKAPVYVEATLNPQGTLKSDLESLAKQVAGIDNVGELIVTELEESAQAAGKPFDYAKEVEPWLGEKAGLFLAGYDGNNFQEVGIAVQTTDPGATQQFIDENYESENGEPPKEGSYEGVDFKLEGEEQAIGVVGDFLVYAGGEKIFKTMVDASNGESLADESSFANAVAAAPSGSFADVFVDVGGLIGETGNGISPEAKIFLEATGINPEEATAVASLVPGSNQVEIDLSTDLTGKNPQSGDASQLLGSLPGGSLAAFASAEFGKRFGEAIDRIDARGIPGQIEPNELKKGLKASGIDLEGIASSLGDLGVFAQGNTKKNLTGAVVLTTKGSAEATNTVSNIGLFLRATGTPGVTAISGKATGFSVRSPELGSQPLVVAAEGKRIAISYGLAASAQALSAGSSATLAENPAYKEAVAALGGTPISGFVAGSAALQLADSMIPADKRESFGELRPYLSKIGWVAIGSGSSGDLTAAKVIVGLTK
jgi:hypothetical protein